MEGVITRIRRRRRQDDALSRRRVLRSLRDASNPFEASAGVFTGKYRLTADMAMALVAEIKATLSGGNKCFSIPPEIKVSIVDNFLKVFFNPFYSQNILHIL